MADGTKGPAQQIFSAFSAAPNPDEVLEPGKIGQKDVTGALAATLEGVSCAVLTAALRDPETGIVTSGLAAFDRNKDGSFSPMVVGGKPLGVENDAAAFADFVGKTPEQRLGVRPTQHGLAPVMAGTGKPSAKGPSTVGTDSFSGDAAQCKAIRKNGLKQNPGMS